MVSSLAVVAGLVYGNFRLGEMFYDFEAESRAGFDAIVLDFSRMSGEGKALLHSLLAQAEITRTDFVILRRDLDMQVSKLQTKAVPQLRLLSPKQQD